MNDVTTTNSSRLASIKKQLALDASSVYDLLPSSNRSIKLKVGDSLAVVILDYIYETLYYKNAYTPGVDSLPTAFSLGRNPETMVWHENSHPDFAGKLCSSSDVTRWGSAPDGKGKLAREHIRLAVISAGTVNNYGNLVKMDSKEDMSSCSIMFIKLPVMSKKLFTDYMLSLSHNSMATWGVVTRIAYESTGKYDHMTHAALKDLDDDYLEIAYDRRQAAMKLIEQPYPPYNSDVMENIEQETQEEIIDNARF